MPLIFACKWDKIRVRTWSYTCFSIYQKLQKYYDIEDFDINENYWSKLKRRLLMKIHRYDLQSSLLKRNTKRFKKIYGNKDCKVFQFSECPITSNTKNYIYQDIAVSYLLHMKETNDPDYNYCGFSEVPEKYLLTRMNNQKEFYERCNAIFTMSRWLADYMIKECSIPAEKVFPVGAGINMDVSRIRDDKKSGKRILFVGKDFERKGGYLVLAAFELLQRKYNNAYELYLVGPIQNPVKNSIEGVHFIGNIPNSEVSDYYNLCDIFCMPSYFEAYGIVLVEALCYGLPCITRNKYAMAEIIQDGQNGYLLQDDNVDTFALKMYELLINDTIKEQVKHKRTEYLANYSWERVASDMKKVIDAE